MARHDKARLVILGMLGHQPATGYDLQRRIAVQLGSFWKASFGQIYPALKALEHDALVTSRTSTGAKGRPKVVFMITPAGRKELTRALAAFSPSPTMRAEFLIKVFFGASASPEDLRALLDNVRRHHVAELERFALYARQIDESPQGAAPDHTFFLLTLDLGRRISQTLVDWSRAVDAAIASSAGPARSNKVALAPKPKRGSKS